MPLLPLSTGRSKSVDNASDSRLPSVVPRVHACPERFFCPALCQWALHCQHCHRHFLNCKPGTLSLLCLSAWSREQKTVLQSTSHLTPHLKRVGLLWRHATGQSCLSGRKDTAHSGLHRGDRLTGKACRRWRAVLHAGHVQENDSCKRTRICSGQ